MLATITQITVRPGQSAQDAIRGAVSFTVDYERGDSITPPWAEAELSDTVIDLDFAACDFEPSDLDLQEVVYLKDDGWCVRVIATPEHIERSVYRFELEVDCVEME